MNHLKLASDADSGTIAFAIDSYRGDFFSRAEVEFLLSSKIGGVPLYRIFCKLNAASPAFIAKFREATRDVTLYEAMKVPLLALTLLCDLLAEPNVGIFLPVLEDGNGNGQQSRGNGGNSSDDDIYDDGAECAFRSIVTRNITLHSKEPLPVLECMPMRVKSDRLKLARAFNRPVSEIWYPATGTVDGTSVGSGTGAGTGAVSAPASVSAVAPASATAPFPNLRATLWCFLSANNMERHLGAERSMQLVDMVGHLHKLPSPEETLKTKFGIDFGYVKRAGDEVQQLRPDGGLPHLLALIARLVAATPKTLCRMEHTVVDELLNSTGRSCGEMLCRKAFVFEEVRQYFERLKRMKPGDEVPMNEFALCRAHVQTLLEVFPRFRSSRLRVIGHGDQARLRMGSEVASHPSSVHQPTMDADTMRVMMQYFHQLPFDGNVEAFITIVKNAAALNEEQLLGVMTSVYDQLRGVTVNIFVHALTMYRSGLPSLAECVYHMFSDFSAAQLAALDRLMDAYPQLTFKSEMGLASFRSTDNLISVILNRRNRFSSRINVNRTRQYVAQLERLPNSYEQMVVAANMRVHEVEVLSYLMQVNRNSLPAYRLLLFNTPSQSLANYVAMVIDRLDPNSNVEHSPLSSAAQTLIEELAVNAILVDTVARDARLVSDVVVSDPTKLSAHSIYSQSHPRRPVHLHCRDYRFVLDYARETGDMDALDMMRGDGAVMVG